MTDKEFDCIMKHFYKWYESGGCDADVEESFWEGYKLCMTLNKLNRYVKDIEDE